MNEHSNKAPKHFQVLEPWYHLIHCTTFNKYSEQSMKSYLYDKLPIRVHQVDKITSNPYLSLTKNL